MELLKRIRGRHQYRLVLCGHKAVEAGAVCLVLMVQGQLMDATLSHFMIATKTGLLAMSPALGLTFTRHARHFSHKWAAALFFGVCTFIADGAIHASHYPGEYSEAAFTGLGAFALSLAGREHADRKANRRPRRSSVSRTKAKTRSCGFVENPPNGGRLMTNAFDVIVVGARCAGSPTAMLLSRKGYRVLVVDRATFPSDTISTHVVHPRAVAALARWGLLERLNATGCPPIHTYTFDFGHSRLRFAGNAGESRVVLPASDSARQAAGRRCGGSRRRDP
jgi:hypothetical protein